MPQLNEAEFKRHIGFSYAAFLQQTAAALARQGDASGMSSVMVSILKNQGLDPVGLSGVKVDREIAALNGLILEHRPAVGTIETFSREAVVSRLDLDAGISDEAMVAALLARVPEPTAPSGLRKLLGAKPGLTKAEAYCFLVFWSSTFLGRK